MKLNIKVGSVEVKDAKLEGLEFSVEVEANEIKELGKVAKSLLNELPKCAKEYRDLTATTKPAPIKYPIPWEVTKVSTSECDGKCDTCDKECKELY